MSFISLFHYRLLRILLWFHSDGSPGECHRHSDFCGANLSPALRDQRLSVDISTFGDLSPSLSFLLLLSETLAYEIRPERGQGSENTYQNTLPCTENRGKHCKILLHPDVCCFFVFDIVFFVPTSEWFVSLLVAASPSYAACSSSSKTRLQ